MYLRRSIRSYRGRTYTSYLLVESVHTANGPRQKAVCSLGDLSPRSREEWLKLAHKIEDALVGQPNFRLAWAIFRPRCRVGMVNSLELLERDGQ